MKWFLTLLCSACSAICMANPFKLGGFTEAVFVVSDLSATSELYVELAGWEVRHSGDADNKLKALWRLPDEAEAKYVLLANKGENKGFVRLVQLGNVPQQRIRSNTQSWDTGGIFDVNVRVADMQKKSQQMQAAGFIGVSDPVAFTFGPFEVKEWITTGHDGVTLAMIERIKPTLEGWPNLRELSRVFNATQVVKDIEVSLPFYQEVLGFQTYLEHKGVSKKAGPNVLGLPYNLTTEIPRSVYILHPDKINEGSVELLQFHGADGRDVGHLAAPPNLGIVTLRFPVDDIDALQTHLAQHKVRVLTRTRMNLPPYGDIDIMAIETPDKTWLEFYQVIKAP